MSGYQEILQGALKGKTTRFEQTEQEALQIAVKKEKRKAKEKRKDINI